MTRQLSRCTVMRDPLALAVAESTRLVKAENLDAWLSLLLAPAAARPALLAVWALVAETARLPWRLHEPLLCRLRMEFWRAGLMGEETPALPGGDVAPAPLLALWPPALPRQDMAETLAQLSLLADGALDDADAVRQWSEAAFTPLLRTLLQAACISRDGGRLEMAPDMNDAGVDEALRALARAYGTGFLLRRVPWPRRSTTAGLLGATALRDVNELVHAAWDDFSRARAHAWPRQVLPALWPASLMQRWLQEAAGQTAFPQQAVAMPSQLARQWFLLRRWLWRRL